MANALMTGGATAWLMAIGLLGPAMVCWCGGEALSWGGWIVVDIAGGLLVLGGALFTSGLARWSELAMPGGVRAAVMANCLFAAFFALEISDGIIRREGRLHVLSSALLLPSLSLLAGLVAGNIWAWRIARILAAVGAAWFFLFVAIIPFAELQADGIPTPWWGRVYMICVSVVLGSIMAAAFSSMGEEEALDYFAHSPIPVGPASGMPAANE